MAQMDQGLRFDSGTIRFDALPPPPVTPPNRMAKVKLNLEDKNPQQVLNASSAHITAMATPEGTALFATPVPNVADYLALHTALANGINLVPALEGQLEAARNALPGLVQALKVNGLEVRAKYVEAETGGDAALIPISGFAVAATPGQLIGPLPQPQNVKAVMGTYPGLIRVSCGTIKGTQTYVTECRLHDDPTSQWQQAKLSTKSRCEVTGLISGALYAFRMAAIGAAGQSPWSDEAVCRAP